METLIQRLDSYTLGLFSAVKKYCDFANRQARNEADLFFLGLGPIGLIGLLLELLPNWLGIAIALILFAPAIYAVILILSCYSERSRK